MIVNSFPSYGLAGAATLLPWCTLYKVLQYGALVGYDGPARRILSKNHSVGSFRTYLLLLADLSMRRIAKLPVDTAPNQFIWSPGLGDGSLRDPWPLLQLSAHTDSDAATLRCRRYRVFLKRDIRMPFITSRRHLRYSDCLGSSGRSASVSLIFSLFAEGFH